MEYFEIKNKDSSTRARTGVLHLPHGDVKTPVFMPVGTNATVKAITKDDLEEIGFEIILANTYHLYLRPGADLLEEAGGLHGFTKWNRNFLTDSGGFQVFSLSKLRKIKSEGVTFQSHIDGSKHFLSPEKVVDLQVQFNSDIQMQLDVCTGFGVEYKEAVKALQTTNDWLVRSKNEWLKMREEKNYQGLLFPIVQGNFFKDLRQQSAQFVSELDMPGIAIGGLSVGESFDLFGEILNHTVQFLPETKAKYVMGIGTPDFILESIENGIDMFDCVLPTRNARNGSFFTKNGPISIKQARYEHDFSPIDSECNCKVCKTYSRSYMRHLYKNNEILSSMLASYHNLYFLNNMVLEARQAIDNGTFAEYKKSFLARYEGGQK